MEFTLIFVKLFFYIMGLALPILLFLLASIIALGVVVGRIEGWRASDSIYWSFITGTTVGYGDIRPVKHVSRIFAVLITCLGLVFTGIMVSIAVSAMSEAFKKTTDKKELLEIQADLQEIQEETQVPLYGDLPLKIKGEFEERLDSELSSK